MKYKKQDKDLFRPYDITFTVESQYDNNVLVELTRDPSKLKVMQTERPLPSGAMAQTCTDLPYQQCNFLTSLRSLIRE